MHPGCETQRFLGHPTLVPDFRECYGERLENTVRLRQFWGEIDLGMSPAAGDAAREGSTPKLTQVTTDDDGRPDGTVGVGTGGTSLYLRATRRDGDRLFTADGDWLELISGRRLGSRLA